MKEMFLFLVNHFAEKGEIKEANLYSRGNYMSIVVNINGKIYNCSVSKQESNGNDND